MNYLVKQLLKCSSQFDWDGVIFYTNRAQKLKEYKQSKLTQL